MIRRRRGFAYTRGMDIDPGTLSTAERYKLLIGCVVPRPIAFVSTVSPAGRTNLAPFSFFTGVGSDPLTLLFCPSNKPDGTEKDTLRNAAPAPGGVGQFVVNVATEGYAGKVAGAAEPLEFGESEFDLVGLTPTPSVRVAPPRVAESPVAFECETSEVIRLNPGAPGGGNVVLGRVLHVYIRDDLINDRLHIDADSLGAIGRLAGLEYCRTRDRFTMPMGRAAL